MDSTVLGGLCKPKRKGVPRLTPIQLVAAPLRRSVRSRYRDEKAASRGRLPSVDRRETTHGGTRTIRIPLRRLRRQRRTRKEAHRNCNIFDESCESFGAETAANQA